MQFIDYYYYEYQMAPSPFASFLSLLLGVAGIVACWLLFKKAGKPGWASIVPFYNVYTLFEITWGSGWRFLMLLDPHLQHRPGHPDLHQAGQGLRQERRLRGGPDLPALRVHHDPGLRQLRLPGRPREGRLSAVRAQSGLRPSSGLCAPAGHRLPAHVLPQLRRQAGK